MNYIFELLQMLADQVRMQDFHNEKKKILKVNSQTFKIQRKQSGYFFCFFSLMSRLPRLNSVIWTNVFTKPNDGAFFTHTVWTHFFFLGG